MKKSLCFCLLTTILGVFMIASGTFLSFLSSYREDVKEQKTIAMSIKNEYASFNDKTQSFRNELEKFEEVFGTYFEDMPKNEDVTLDTLNKIETILKETNESTTMLKKACTEDYINDPEIIERCRIFQKNYETMVNTYVKMIIGYNRAVEKYNGWNKVEPMNTYKSKIATSYIDYDKDGIYLGAN